VRRLQEGRPEGSHPPGSHATGRHARGRHATGGPAPGSHLHSSRPRRRPVRAERSSRPGGNIMTVTTSTTTIEGMLTVTIAKHKFTLSGTLAKSAVIVEYHADFADSITLGTLTD